jgi:hypothetical protein
MKDKKMMTLIGFCVGAIVFTTTAYADIVAKTGYTELKKSIKYTAKMMATELDNYSTSLNVVIKEGDRELFSAWKRTKVDGNKLETTDTFYNMGVTGQEGYQYRDLTTTIQKGEREGKEVYYLTERNAPSHNNTHSDPFDFEEADDLERILDAAIGNVKDYLIASERADGTTEIQGNLSQVQIPPLINAISSFVFKQMYKDGIFQSVFQDNDPLKERVLKDVYIKSVQMRTEIDENDLMEKVYFSLVTAAKSEEGGVYDLSFDLVYKIEDIGNTVVEKPNLEGKTVIHQNEIPKQYAMETQKYIGTYSAPIVVEREDQLVKIGERQLEIQRIEGEIIYGTYREQRTSDERGLEVWENFDFIARTEYKMATITSMEFPETQEKSLHHTRVGAGLGSLSFNEADGSIQMVIYSTKVFDDFQYSPTTTYKHSSTITFNRVFE